MGERSKGCKRGVGGIRGPGDVRVNKTYTPVSSTYRARVSRWSPNSWVSPSTTASVPLSPPLASPTFTTPYTHESIYSPACLPRATAYHPSSTNTPTQTPLYSSSSSPRVLSPLSSSLEIWGARCTLSSSCSPPSLQALFDFSSHLLLFSSSFISQRASFLLFVSSDREFSSRYQCVV